MSVVHRTLAGDWETCTAADCELKFHLPDLTVAEVEQMPQLALLAILEVLDPPTVILPDGEKVWLHPSTPRHASGGRFSDNLHREYDLPAVIYPDGTQQWFRGNLLHREGGKPAVIEPDGRSQYWRHGARYSDPNDLASAVSYVTPRFPRGLN